MSSGLRGRARAVTLIACFTLSGASALVYEVAWTRALGLVVGTSAVASTVVLAAFMAGLGAGAWLGGRISGRLARPLLAYALVEVLTGILGCWFLPGALHALQEVGSDQVLWAAAAIVVLPAMALGASFPLACGAAGDAGPRPETLYGWNTLGAVLGAMGAAHLLLPGLGLLGTQRAAAAGSVVAGIAALALVRGTAPRATGEVDERLRSVLESPGASPAIVVAAGLSGFCALALEVVHGRVLALLLGGTVVAFSAMLAAFLGGSAAGSLAVAALGGRLDARAARRVAAIAFGAASVLALSVAWQWPEMPYGLIVLHRTLGASPLLEAAAAAAPLALPAMGLGAGFAALLRATRGDARDGGAHSAGLLTAWNTLGAIGGAALGGLWLVPMIGLSHTLACASAAAALAAGIALGGRIGPVVGAVVAGALFFIAPALSPSLLATGVFSYLDTLPADLTRERFLSQFEAGRIDLLYARDGRTSTVTVERFPLANTVYLKNDGKVDGSAPIATGRASAADMATQVSLAALPLALVAEPRSALVIGLGGGVTAGSAAAFLVSATAAPSADRGSLQRIDVVEIEQEVGRALEATHAFDAWNGTPFLDPRVTLHVEDARFFLRRAAPASYDAIISQPAEPWLTGVANLFTREFFSLGRRALRPGGIFCQWVQLYGLDEEALKTLLETFRAEFPSVLVAHPRGSRELLLVGSMDRLTIDPSRVAARIAPAKIAAMLGRARIRGADDLLGEIVAGPADIEAFSSGASLNTDDDPRVELRAPKTRFLPARAADAIFAHLTGAARDIAPSFVPLPSSQVTALAEGAANSGNAGAAEAWLRALGDTAQAHRLLGDLRLKMGDETGALLEWNEALKRDPTDKAAIERLGNLRGRLGG